MTEKEKKPKKIVKTINDAFQKIKDIDLSKVQFSAEDVLHQAMKVPRIR